jgi:hypothetical protein
MRLVLPLTAAMLIAACNTSAPNDSEPSPESSSSVGSAAAALRKLGQLDASDVQKCRDAAQRCSEGDSGSEPICARIGAHCDALEAQLAADRSELEQCLQEAADCEQAAADPADCAQARAACEPADGDFHARRNKTLECASRAEQCIAPSGRGFGPGFGRRGGDEADAGAVVCDADAVDFVGCCQGHHRDGDAGVGIRGGFGAPQGGFGAPQGGFGAPQGGFGLPPGRPGPFQHDDGEGEGADAGAPRRGIPMPAPFRHAP